MIITEFSPHAASQATYKEIANWGPSYFTFRPCLSRDHADPNPLGPVFSDVQEHWQYSIVVFFGMILMVVVGTPLVVVGTSFGTPAPRLSMAIQ